MAKKAVKKSAKKASKVIEAIYVDFGDDGLKALYLDGKLQLQGDGLHGNFRDEVSNWIDGAIWAGANFNRSNVWIEYPDNEKSAETVPNVWPDGKYSEWAE